MTAGAEPISIDWTRCDAHGLCAELAPHVFTRDPWGFPIVRASAASAPDVRRVVAMCPALALRENS